MTKMGVAAIFETRGNDDCHVILRGGKAPNCDDAGVAASCAVLRAAGLPEQVMVDVSHGNSGKRHERQIAIASELAERIAAGERRVFGLMIESHLEAGRQDLVPACRSGAASRSPTPASASSRRCRCCARSRRRSRRGGAGADADVGRAGRRGRPAGWLYSRACPDPRLALPDRAAGRVRRLDRTAEQLHAAVAARSLRRPPPRK
jgi:hypothetical protein